MESCARTISCRIAIFGGRNDRPRTCSKHTRLGSRWADGSVSVPVRPKEFLPHENENGKVWAVYNDFDFIARRYGIADRMKEFKMASEVVASITSTIH